MFNMYHFPVFRIKNNILKSIINLILNLLSFKIDNIGIKILIYHATKFPYFSDIF